MTQGDDPLFLPHTHSEQNIKSGNHGTSCKSSVHKSFLHKSKRNEQACETTCESFAYMYVWGVGLHRPLKTLDTVPKLDK